MRYRQRNCAEAPSSISAVWVAVSVHWSAVRLARQEVSLPKPTASAGAQVGTVSATV